MNSKPLNFSKTIFGILFLLFSLNAFSQYCISNGDNTDGYLTGVRLVNFNSINNATPAEDNDYSDFTAISTTVTQSSTYNLTVNVNTDGNYTIHAIVWIDWNQDNDFLDAGERYDLGTANNTSNGATDLSPLSITIPAAAAIGATRMRVSARWNQDPTSCLTGFDGEVEDYTVNVISSGPAPEINIQGGSPLINILSGNTAISATDDTDFGSVNVTSGSTPHTFTIENTGSANLTISSISSSIADFTITGITLPATVTSGNTTTFVVTFDPTTVGTKTATISIANNDTTGGEDPYTFNVEGVGIVPPPQYTIYYENFDANNGSWTASNPGGNTIWTYGLNAFLDGTEGNHWYTSNYNNYANNSKTYATSPVIDLTGFNNLVFKIDIKYTTEPNWDGMNIEYSTNGGTSWTVLGAYAATPVNFWYNDTDVDGIGNNIDGWSGENTRSDDKVYHMDFVEASIALPSTLNNNANAQFRVQFGSDGGTTDNGANFDNVIIQGDYITPLSDPSFAPGAVTSNLKVWLKANSGTSTTTDGSAVSTWSDKAYDNDAIGITTQRPVYNNSTAENINFNPVINFDKTASQEMRGKGGFYSQDYFVVLEPNIPYDAATLYGQQAIAGKYSTVNFTSDGTGLGLGLISARYTDAVVAHTISSFPSGASSGPNDTSYGRAYQDPTNTVGGVMLINVKTNASNNSTEIYLNGERIDNATGQSGDGSDLNFNEYDNLQYYVGTGRFTSNGHIVDGHFDGKMAEFLSYSTKNSVADKAKVQSSLAIKYGITLHTGTQKTETDVDYVDSAGSIIWNATTNAGYNFDITGIGRDDNAELNQKQSKTVNTANDITIGLTEIAATNSANANTFANDKNFVVWGNDNGALTAAIPDITVDMSEGILPLLSLATEVTFTAISRTWKVVEKGTIGMAKISIPTTMLSATLSPPGDYLMFISASPTFSPTSEYRVMTANGSNLETSYDFPSNGIKYITFGYSPEATFIRSIKFTGSTADGGTNDYLDAGDVLDLNATAFTISAWIKRENTSASIISKRDNAYSNGGYDFSINASGNLEMSWKNGSTQTITSSVAIPVNKWHHVAVIYNGTDAKLYIDGVEDTAKALGAPIANTESFIIAAAGGSSTTAFFIGNIDEVRIWDVALTEAQLRFVINQEIEANGLKVDGSYFAGLGITPTKNDINVPIINWANLQGYYPMSTYTFTNCKDASGNGNTAALKNLRTVDHQTAPLPYVSTADGAWDTAATWLNNTVQDLPNSFSIIDGITPINWNIVEINNNVTIKTNTTLGREREVLALMVNSNTLTVNGLTSSTTGNGLTVTHYLNLDGKIDLEGESQLIQTTDSDLAVGASGVLERDQQGEGNLFRYNDWSSPVVSNFAAETFTVAGVLRDGTTSSTPVAITFVGGYDGAVGPPIQIANYWIYAYRNLVHDSYTSWQQIGSTGTLKAGEGFLMKGTGAAADQNYVFQGKPNNGAINLNLTAVGIIGNDYLVGNPYPSALDADQFIVDNATSITGTLYFWEHYGGDTHNLAGYQAGYASYNLSGGIGTGVATATSPDPDVDPTLPASPKTPGRYIAIGQGFFVQGDADGGTLNFNNGQRVFQKEGTASSVFMKTAKSKKTGVSNKTTTDIRPKYRIGFEITGKGHRQLLLTLDERATDGVDWGFDGEIYDLNPDDMFWVINEEKYVIQGTNSISLEKEIPLGIKIKNETPIRINVDALENVEENTAIYIKDKLTGETYNITNQAFEINLEAGEYVDRFVLAFQPRLKTLGEIELFEGISIYMNNTNSEIQLNRIIDAEILDVTLFNYLGQQVRSWNTNLTERSVALPIQITTGAYIVKVTTNAGVITKKIIIK